MELSEELLPATDADTAPWWDATRERRLLVQRCKACGLAQHPPRALCTRCGGEPVLVDASGHGRVWSFSVVRRPPSQAFVAPYAVALVRLAEDPVLLSRVVGCPLAAIRCDEPVTVAWEPLPDGRHLPVFTPRRLS